MVIISLAGATGHPNVTFAAQSFASNARRIIYSIRHVVLRNPFATGLNLVVF
jgi:hypothetical protein